MDMKIQDDSEYGYGDGTSMKVICKLAEEEMDC
jgi:hypothetical protein